MKPNQLSKGFPFSPCVLLLLLSFSYTTSNAQCSEGINQTFAILNFGSGNTYYNLQSTSGNPNFEDANLGSFCPNGTLILEGGQNQIYKCNGADIWQNQIWYRIYLTSASPTGAFTPITEYYQSGYGNGCGGADQTWEANGANINVLSGLSAGTYYLEVYSTADYQYCGSGTLYASNNSYNYRATFTVNATPTPTVTNDTVCSGDTATLTATGGTSYVWSLGSATTTSIKTPTAGTYTVTATNSSGCTATASGTVTVHSNPTVTVNSPRICAGSTATLTATGGTSYVWNTDSTRSSITTATAGTYTVTATNSSGCTASASGTVIVNPNPTAYAGDDTFVDFVTNVILGDSASVGGTPPYTFSWTPGKGLSDSTTQFPVCTPLATTKYYLTVTDSNGCTNKDSVIVSFNKGNNPLTDIVYSAQNLTFTDSGQYLEFDLFASDTPTNLLFSQGQIYLTYDTTYFGSNLISSGAITVTKGQAIDSPYYNLSVTDSTRNMMKLSITHTASPASLVNLDSVNQQLCHFKFRVASLGTPAATFDSILMVGQSLYQRTATSLEFPYDLVQVRGLVGALRSDDINVQIANVNYSTNPMTFEVQVQSGSGDYFYSADIDISYNTNNFGTDVVTSGHLSCSSSFDVTDYSLNPTTDVNSSTFKVSIQGSFDANGNPYDPSSPPTYSYPTIGSYIAIATCSLAVQNCCYSTTGGDYLSIGTVSANYATFGYDDNGDPSDTANDWTATQDNSGAYSPGTLTGYSNSNTSICPNSSPSPTITSLFAPDASQTITAGTRSVLTITGSGFGCTVGQVLFPNADTGGLNMMHTQTPDIQTWDDDKITVWVPSVQGDPGDQGYYPAGSGQIEVKTANGDISSLSSDALTIPYALKNLREPTTLSAFPVALKNQNLLGGYTFRPANYITGDTLTAITTAMNDWICQVGVRFTMGTDTSYSAVNGFDHVNSILFTPSSNPNVLCSTTLTSSYPTPCSLSTDTIAVVNDIDMAFNSSIGGGTVFDLDTSTANVPAGQASLLGVSRHEFGHAAGLFHVDEHTLMFWQDPGPGNPPAVIKIGDQEGGIHEILNVSSYYLSSPCGMDTQFVYPCPTLGFHTGINDVADNPFAVSVYPNPFNESILVHAVLSETEDIKVSIFDVLGQELIAQDYGEKSGTVTEQIDASAYSIGMYVVRVTIGSNTTLVKLIKK